jgi:thymidylate kinase/predicted ATP-grasp superfamily ATP-dependent carboligase
VEPFAGAVVDAVRTGGYDLVFGGDDVEVLALSLCRDRFEADVPYAEHEVVVRSVDKLELVQAARSVGLAAPRTVAATPEAVAEATRRPDAGIVVKPRLHWNPGRARGRMPAALCRTPEEVVQAVAVVEAAGGEAVLQDRIEGTLGAVTALCAQGGRVVAESHQVASRVSPAWRTSTRAETRPIDPELSRQVADLLGQLGWLGIANLQFLHPPSGPPQLIDFNGRFYGSLALAQRAGLDLPVRWALLAATGEDDGRIRTAPAGVRYQALEEDLRRARVERRGGLLADLAGTALYAPRAAHSTWAAGDPRPTAARLTQLARSRRHRHGEEGGPPGPVRRGRAAPVIAISGLDGSGKSTQARALISSLEARGYDAVMVWNRLTFNPSLFRVTAPLRLAVRGAMRLGLMSSAPREVQADGDVIPAEHSATRALRERVPMVSVLWVTFVALVHAVGVRRSAVREIRRGRIVISDRYVLDSLVQLHDRYGRVHGVGLQARLLRLLTPAPLAAYFLDVPGDEARRRKPEEFSVEELDAHRRAYLGQAGQLGVRVLDGRRPPDELAALIADEVSDRLAALQRAHAS